MKNVFIISGPAGSGKDAVIEGLGELLSLERIVTSTTRSPRPGESEGHPYHFLSREVFESMLAEDRFVEHSVNENGERYGVTKDEIERVSKTDRIGIWKLDWKGVITAKAIYPTIPAIFIIAPTDILETRLRKRDGADHDDAYFHDRMDYTKEWLKHTDIYDYTIENEEGKLDETIEKVRSLIQSKLSHFVTPASGESPASTF